jgi:hypothetical protein
MRTIGFLSLFSLLFVFGCSENDPPVDEPTAKEIIYLNSYLLEKNLFSVDDTLGLFDFYTVNDSALLREDMANIRAYFWNENYPTAKSTALFSKAGARWILQDDDPKSVYDDRATYLEIEDATTDSILLAVETDSIMFLVKQSAARLMAVTSTLPSSSLLIDLREPARPGFATTETSAHRYLWFLKDIRGNTRLGVETANPDFKFYDVTKVLATLHPEYNNPTVAQNSDYLVSVIGLDTNRKALFMAEKGFSN